MSDRTRGVSFRLDQWCDSAGVTLRSQFGRMFTPDAVLWTVGAFRTDATNRVVLFVTVEGVRAFGDAERQGVLDSHTYMDAHDPSNLPDWLPIPTGWIDAAADLARATLNGGV